MALGAGRILAGCGGGSSNGSSQSNLFFGPDAVRVSIIDGSISAVRLGRGYVRISRDNKPLEVGFELLDGALKGLPASDYNIPIVFNAAMPTEASGTLFKQIGLSYWAGHDPHGIGEVPHFHAVFLFQPVQFPSQNLQRELTPVKANEIAPGFLDGRDVPTAIVPGVGNGFEDPSLPHMNPHWYGATYNFFYYDGHLNGVGTGATADFLETTQAQTLAIAQPSIYPKAGLYPRRVKVTYNAARKSHFIGLDNLQAAVSVLA